MALQTAAVQNAGGFDLRRHSLRLSRHSPETRGLGGATSMVGQLISNANSQSTSTSQPPMAYGTKPNKSVAKYSWCLSL